MSKTYFINNLDSYLGRNILEKIRGPDTEDQPPENNVIGTKLNPEDFEKPRGVRKIMKRTKPLLFKKYLTEQDVLIYDTMYGNKDDVLFALEAYQKAKELTGEKILILISDLSTWTMNNKKVRKEIEKEQDDPDAQPDDQGDGIPADEPIDEPPAKPDSAPIIKGFDDDDDEPKNPNIPEPDQPADQVDEPPAEPTVEVEEVPPEPILLPWTDKDYLERLPLQE